MGECSFGFLCGRSITANFCLEISGSICISFLVSHPVASCKAVYPTLPRFVCGAVHAPWAGTGCWSWAHLLRCENTLVPAASQSCLTASQTLCTKSNQSSPGKPALNFEYFGNWSAVVAIRKLSSLLIDIMSRVYVEITAVKWVFLLWIVGFVLGVFNPANKHGTERKGKLFALFSGTKYWENREFSSCLSFASTSCFFLFSLNVQPSQGNAFTLQHCGIFTSLWCIVRKSIQYRHCYPYLCIFWNSIAMILLVFFFFFFSSCLLFYLMFVLSDCFGN